MRLRKVFGALVVLGALGGCDDIKGDCGEQDSKCDPGQYCHLTAKVCVAPRYSALELMAPTKIESNSTVVGGGPLRFQARLMLSEGARPVYSPQLNLTVTPSTGGTPTVLTLQSTGEGNYSVEWTPPPGEGVYTFKVAHPETWGPSREVQVTVDRTAPVLAMLVPEAQPAAPKDGFSYADPMADKAWARDQTVTVRVESDSASTDIEPTSLQVVVRGHNGGMDVTGLAVKQVTPCAKAYCGTVDVPLWRPGLDAFRGDFKVEVAAKDKVGNERRVSGSIPVTRWKWAFDGASGPMSSAPAIGDKGTIYVGSSGTNGKVFALDPGGTRKWAAPVGQVIGSPAVGTPKNGVDRIYVATAPSTIGGTASGYILDGNGTTLVSCTHEYLTGSAATSFTVHTTQFTGETQAYETGSVYVSEGGLVELRPDSSTNNGCFIGGETQQTEQGAGLLSLGEDIYFGTKYDSTQSGNPPDTFELEGRTYSTLGAARKPRYPYYVTTLPFTGVAYAGDYMIVVAFGGDSPGTGGINAFDYRGPSSLWTFPTPLAGPGPVRNLIVGTGNTVFFGRDIATGAAPLVALDMLTHTPRFSVPNAGSFPGAPVLGASNTLYTASAAGPAADVGEVSAWSADTLTPRWKLSDSVGRARASPSLDCVRTPEGVPAATSAGLLYVPSVDGHLYTFVVDSPGLEKNAPWPKYQHDARNTGNPANPVTNCP